MHKHRYVYASKALFWPATIKNFSTSATTLITLGGDSTKAKFWKPVIYKIKSRLSIWQGNILSKFGRTKHIRFVLSTFPIYYISMFKLPNFVAKEIIRIKRNFFWIGYQLKKWICPIKWEDLVVQKSLGALGFGNINIKNWNLAFKWWWKFSDDNESLWKRVIKFANIIDTNKSSFLKFGIINQGTMSKVNKVLEKVTWLKLW